MECFDCSCCPPNLNRLLSSLGNYIYGIDGDTLKLIPCNCFANRGESDMLVWFVQN